MAFCANCGTQLPDGAMFCGTCGSKLSPAQPQQPVYIQPEQSAYPQPTYAQPEQPPHPQPTYTQPEQPVYTQPTYAQPVQPPYTQPVYPQPEQPKKKNIWKILLPIIGGVVLTAIIVALWLLVFSKTHVESIEIVGEDELLLLADTTYHVECEVYPEEHDDEIRWESSDEDVATVQNGWITAVGEGTCTITVQADSGAAATIDVEVYEIIYVENIMLDVYSLSLMTGDTYTVSWSVNPSDYTEALTWSSTDTAVATVSNYGEIAAVGSGSCYITVSSDFGVSEEIYVEVSSLSDAEQVICGEWSSYGAYFDGTSDYYYGLDLYLYSDHTGVLYHDGESIYFEWVFDFSDEETHFYDAYTDDGGYFWFTYDHAGQYAGDLDICLEDGLWIYFE